MRPPRLTIPSLARRAVGALPGALAGALAAVLALVAGPAAQAEGRAFEIADYYRTAFVRSPDVSPDGARVVFVVQRYALESGESWTELWSVAADPDVAAQEGAKQLTFGRTHPGSPTFAPDGKAVIFTDDRGEGKGTQLWSLPVDGGEARRLTDFPVDLADPVVSPDGRWIAVTARVIPDCGVDADCNRKRLESRAEGPLNAHLADALLYRHWTSWADGTRAHILLVDAKTGAIARDLTPGDFESPIFMLGGGRGYAFSPDSQELCFVSNRDADQATSTNADLWTVPVAGGEAVNRTAANRGWDGSPLYSPDGKTIAFRSQATPGYEADLFRLALLDRASGKVTYLTDRETFDDWVDEMAWLPDGSGLVFQAPRAGRNPLFRIDRESRWITELPIAEGTIDAWETTPDGASVVFARRKVGEPAELYSMALPEMERFHRMKKLPARTPRPLTAFNEALLREVDFRPVEEMWVDTPYGDKVQVFLVKPHGFDPSKKYPLILNVHGGPQSQWTDAYRGDWQVYPGKGYVVAFANPTGSSGRGQDFLDAIACDWGGRVYRDLMNVTDALAVLPWVDAERMGAMGWSYGGYMMMWFQGHTDRFKAQAAMMGIYDLPSMWGATEELWFVEKDLCGVPWASDAYARWSPSRYTDAFRTPALVVTGELDYRVPYTQSLQYFSALQRKGVPSRLVVLPDAGHWPGWYEMAFYYLVHVDWFHRWLGGEAAPWDVEAFLENRVFENETP